ncbi:hypothetical protein [Rhodococcus sp. JG-3]|uniref:hypothetical protein n=1 Tax=Rhodococcus sp. JG-3 TaxID=1305835 RepID=UPI001268C858|nr:hypothetical protein [Rhodococcus sp. JG-3]
MSNRHVLELRIHGVNNTKPQNALDVSDDSVEMTVGDSLGSFWKVTEAFRESIEPHERGYIRQGIEREAYSWGGMARISLGSDKGTIGKTVGGAARVGWALLLPFGLVNVAYWSRRLDDSADSTRQEHPQGKTEGAAPKTGWRSAPGAATLRVAGLLLTLLMAMTAASIVLDLVAVQCYPSSGQRCSNIPSQLDFLERWPQSRRLALLSLIPILGIVALGLLSALTRTRYEQSEISSAGRFDAAEAAPERPLLSTRGFWSHQAITKVTALHHVAATAALVTFCTAVHMAYDGSTQCVTFAQFTSISCVRLPFAQAGFPRTQALVATTALIVLVWIAVKVVTRTDRAADVRTAPKPKSLKAKWLGSDWLPLGFAALITMTQISLLAAFDRNPQSSSMLGISAVPTALAAGLVGIALSALSWRKLSQASTAARYLLALSGPAVALVIVASGHPSLRMWLLCAAGLLGVVFFVAVVRRDRLQSSYEAWGGTAPGVFLLLALMLAMMLSSAVSVAAGDFLNSGPSAAALVGTGTSDSAALAIDPICVGECVANQPEQDAVLRVPRPYVWFGATAPFVVVGMLIVGALAAVRTWTWAPLTGPGLEHSDRSSSASRFAAFSHRAERYVGALAILGTIALLLSLAVAVSGFSGQIAADTAFERFINGSMGFVVNTGMFTLATVGLAVVGLAAGGSVVGGTRPLGLAWDLVCFLPRAGHPLAPPCYAERVVPEVISRCESWLATAPEATSTSGGKESQPPLRTVILSAHSLGSVIAVAVMLSTEFDSDLKNRVFLLSYGSQLRAYFGRLFPELLGPDVLGTPRCRASSLWSHDPWQSEIEYCEADSTSDPADLEGRLADQGEPTSEEPTSDPVNLQGWLASEGANRWINLWRRTDYLGLPVWGYEDKDKRIDRVAEDLDHTGYLRSVLTHSNYPRTKAYEVALDEFTSLPRRQH